MQAQSSIPLATIQVPVQFHVHNTLLSSSLGSFQSKSKHHYKCHLQDILCLDSTITMILIPGVKYFSCQRS